MKKLSLMMVIAALCVGGFSQKSSAPVDQENMGHSSAVLKNAPEWGTEKTASFVHTAYSDGMMVKNLGELATQKAGSEDVKNLGETLVSSYSQANSKLKEIAGELNIKIPDKLEADQQAKLDDLRNKSGSEFNKAFVSTLIDHQKKEISTFTEAKQMVPDQKLKAWITNTLPEMQKQLSQAEHIQMSLSREGESYHDQPSQK